MTHPFFKLTAMAGDVHSRTRRAKEFQMARRGGANVKQFEFRHLLFKIALLAA
jgi:hypothetical protein